MCTYSWTLTCWSNAEGRGRDHYCHLSRSDVQCRLYSIILYNIHCTWYIVQCTLYSAAYTKYSIACTLHVHRVYDMYIVQCTSYNIHRTMYVVHIVHRAKVYMAYLTYIICTQCTSENNTHYLHVHLTVYTI